MTFYLTNGAEAEFNGRATIDFTAPTSGEYAGVLLFGDRSDTSSVHTFNGTADSLMTGSIYTPGAELNFLGDFSGENGCLLLVGDTVNVGGNSTMRTDCTGSGIQWAQAPGSVRLVE